LKQIKENSTPQTNYLSKKIVDATRIAALSELFHELDSDSDGVISYYQMNQESLNLKRKECLKDLFEEMKLQKLKIEKEEFINACLIIMHVQIF